MSSFGTVVAQKKSSVQDLVRLCQGSEEGKDKKRAEKEMHDGLVQDELEVREYASHNVFQLVLLNGYSSAKVFLFYLISIESLISIGLSVGMTIYAYNRIDFDDEGSTFDGTIMNWVLLSFAVITPLTSSISMAFRRREAALVEIALIRATFSELFTAHATWDWDCKPGDSVNTGRTRVGCMIDCFAMSVPGVLSYLFCRSRSRMWTGRPTPMPCSKKSRVYVQTLRGFSLSRAILGPDTR